MELNGEENSSLPENRAIIGILMLDSQFPRILGDLGNPKTWPFPVVYKVVKGATPNKIVRKTQGDMLDHFILAAHELVAQGVSGITTSCGFLSLYQKELSKAVKVPILSSSLMQVEMINRVLPDHQQTGILTISSSALTQAHLEAANVPKGTPIGSTEGGCEFTRVILGDELELDVELARRENIDAALDLHKQHPTMGALVLECTNMTPYAADIQTAIGIPVFTIESFITWFQSGLSPRTYQN